MNRSFALKNKFYLFFLLIISFAIFIYLLYFLINGERGIISFFKIKNLNIELKDNLHELNNQNAVIADKIMRLQTNSMDLDYLEEKIIEKTGYLKNNEILIKFD